MAHVEDSRDAGYAANRVPGRFYVSKRFPPEPGVGHRRFAYEVFDSEGDAAFYSENCWECVLRETPSRQQLKAIFFESPRGVQTLALQRFTRNGSAVKDRKTVHLTAEEVATLRDFLVKIETATLTGEEGVRFSKEAAAQLLEGKALPAGLLGERIDEVVEFLQSDVSAPEVTSLARRRAKLSEFESMLEQDLAESDWQRWFEEEPWVLGFGVAPQFLHKVGQNLETVVAGYDVESGGSRTDGLLQTAGQLSSLVFVELKLPTHRLLKNDHYRTGAWVPDKEVVGGVSQLHRAIDVARRTFGHRHRPKDARGYESDLAIEFCRPRAVLVVGQLSELLDEIGRPHREKFRSFESYRRLLQEPDIITYDELLYRASAAVNLLDPSST